jgi:hypothetical protein
MKRILTALLAVSLAVGLSVPAEAASTKTYNLKSFGWFKFPTTLTMNKKKNSCTSLKYTAKVTNQNMYGGGWVEIRFGTSMFSGDVIDGQIWSSESDAPYQEGSIPICNYAANPSKGYGPVRKGKYVLELMAIDSNSVTSSTYGYIQVK